MCMCIGNCTPTDDTNIGGGTTTVNTVRTHPTIYLANDPTGSSFQGRPLLPPVDDPPVQISFYWVSWS